MSNWKEVKRPFRDALIDAFDVDGLEAMLRYHCRYELERLTGRLQSREKIVDDVIARAVRDGWLQELVTGAIAENPTHTGLQDTVPHIIAGIEREGLAFYQMNSEDAPSLNISLVELRSYLEWMQRRSRNLPLGPLDQSGRDSELIGLNDVFVALDVDKPGEATLRNNSEAVYHAALGHLHAQPQLVLLGDPGSGKSTLLRYLSLCLCNALLEPEANWLTKLQWTVTEKKDENRTTQRASREKAQSEQHQWQKTGLIPIYIQLRDFARQPFVSDDGNAIWKFVCTQLPTELQSAKPILETLALHKRLFFMFDGVDEVPPAERKQVWQAIGAFLSSPYGGNRWVSTCRILSFVEAELPRRHLPVVTLQKLNQEQIDRFIESWYRALLQKQEMTQTDADNKTTALQAASRGHLHELAQNPMLLTIMAIVQTYEGTLPDERAMLYQRCVETLLLRWQREKEKDDKDTPSILQQLGTSQAQLEQLLWQIGWEAHSQTKQRNRTADLPEWDVIKIARKHLGTLEKAELFLTYTEKKAHLLVGSGGADDRRYTFPHRTFQEYLAACYLESERKPLRTIARLAEAGDPWREVINLAFGRLMHVKNDRVKAIDIIVDKLIDDDMPDDDDGWRRVWLTGEACAVIGKNALLEDEEGAEILPLLQKQLVALLQNGALTPQQRAEAGDALGALGDPRPGVCTREPDLIEIPVGDFLYGDRKTETRTIVEPFAIACYPVTVAQFGMFMQDDGYQNNHYWGGEDSPGWKWRISEHPDYRGKAPVTQPRYWQQSPWSGENRPIIGVSWYEAQAYCVWLTEKSGREYRLPTELEWERAARHTDGRSWAWGSEWEDGIINSDEAGINRTTTVGAFPRSAAACGAQDMSGNVWEWTASFYNDNHDTYSVRGGSWIYYLDLTRVARRSWGSPHYSSNNFGFRVVSPVF